MDTPSVLRNLWILFFRASVFAPVNAQFFNPIKPFFVPLVVGLLVWGFVKRPSDRPSWALVLSLAVGPTAAYALGGVLFDWYLAPGKIPAMVGAASAVVLLFDVALQRPKAWRAAVAAGVSLAVLGLCGQIVIGSLNAALETNTRIDAGLWIKDHTPRDATILLEPAGYLPYYAERRTWDETGLGSWQVIEARRQYGDAWLIPFLKRHDVDIVVQRDEFARGRVTFHGYAFTENERKWFDAHYELAQTVVAHPQRMYSFEPLSRLAGHAKRGRVPGLFIYLRRGSP